MSTIDGRVRDAVMAHRYRFLWAVQKLVPEVLADLERDVLPSFRALFRDDPGLEFGEMGLAVWGPLKTSSSILKIRWPSSTPAITWRPSWAADIRGVPLDSGGLRFRDAMEKWAASHHLNSEAILGDAFDTLLFWLASPFGSGIWAPPGARWTPDEMRNVPTLHIEDAWMFEPWPPVEKRLKEQIANYKSDVKKYCAKIGFDADRMRGDRTHHQWLALFQCKRMSPQRIQAWHQRVNGQTVDRTTVSHAIENLARRIGLERRPGRRGPASRR
jgi:hypothetical protein